MHMIGAASDRPAYGADRRRSSRALPNATTWDRPATNCAAVSVQQTVPHTPLRACQRYVARISSEAPILVCLTF